MPQQSIGVSHRVPGRFRLRVAREHRTPETFDRIERSLNSASGVQRTVVNPATGSVLVQHEPDSALEDVLEEAGLSTELIVEALPPRLRGLVRSEASHIGIAASDWFFDLDARVSRATDGWIDLKMAVPLGLLGAASWRFTAAAAEGEALIAVSPYVLLYYAFDSFVKLHQPAIQREVVPAEQVGPRARMAPEKESEL